MYDFQKRTKFLQKWILNPQDLPQNQSLETVPVCIVSQYYPHSNNVLSFHDECKISSDSIVCHRLWSIFVMDRASLFTDHKISGRPILAKYKHFRTNWEHTLWQFSTRFHFFFFEVVVIDAWSRYFVELLRRLVGQLTISLHLISLHDLPYHKTMKKYERFWKKGSFLFLPLKFAIRTWFCNCPQYLCLFRIVVECIPSIHDPGKMLVLPSRLLCWVISTLDQDSVSFQPILCHPHTQIRKILFHDAQRDIPNLELSPSHASRGSSQIAFSHNSPATGWPYKFRSRGTTGSSILHDLGHLCPW